MHSTPISRALRVLRRCGLWWLLFSACTLPATALWADQLLTQELPPLPRTTSADLGLLRQQTEQQQALPAEIHPGSGIFRLRVGPTRDKQQAQQWLNRLRAGNFPAAFFANSNLCS